jgi:hypothetical protein
MTEDSNSIDNINLRKSLRGNNFKLMDQRGENNAMWKGGAPVQDKDGYWLIYKPEHPNRNSRNKVFAHRLIYEHYLYILLDEEVYLHKEEEIHHINKDKQDNSLINLQFMATSKDHKQEHLVNMEGRICRVCGTDNSPVRSDSNNRQKWLGNEEDGWLCVSCDKKEYYIKNKEQIRKRKKERYKLTGKK